MPIDTRFLNSAKDKLTAAARAGRQFVRENARLSIGSAAAMLVAPAVFKNDNRGYMQTATITTPLITAAAYATPSILGSFRSQFSSHIVPTVGRMKDKWVAGQSRKGVRYEDVMQATRDHTKGILPLNVYQDIVNRFHAGRMRKTPDAKSEIGALIGTEDKPGMLSRILDKETVSAGELKYVSNAIHAEKLRTLGATDLLKYQDYVNTKMPGALGAFPGNIKISPIAPILSREEAKAAVAAQMGNSSFIRGMNSRLQRMDGLIFMDKGTMASDALLSRYTASRWGSSSLITARLQMEHPELYSSLSNLSNAPGFNPNDLSILTLEDDAKTIAALRYKGIKGLTIPVVQRNGSVFMGDTFRSIGIARRAYTSDRMMTSDVYAVEALLRGQTPDAIEKELQRVNIFGQVDSSEDFSMLTLPEHAQYVNVDAAFALRSRSAVPSRLYGFANIDEESLKTEDVGFEGLNARSKLSAIQNAIAKHGLTKVGSESGVSKGVFELAETEQLAAFALPNREKQNPAWRSYTKNIGLTEPQYGAEYAPGSTTKVRDILRPFFETDYMSKIAPLAKKREIGIRVAGITGGEKTLFGDLPTTVEGLAGYEGNAVSIIAKERGVSTIEARKAWMGMSNWLSDPANLGAMKRLGSLGEGGFLMRHNLYGMRVERTVRYDVHELRDDWKGLIRSPIEDVLGLKKGQKAVLGFYNGNPVVPEGSQNIIENVHDMGGGVFGVDVREVVPFGTGTKVDAGIKGLVEAVDTQDMRRIKEGLNKYYSLTGTGGFIPEEAEAIQVLHYGQNKEEAQEAILSATGDTLRRLEEYGELGAVSPYMEELAQQGLRYNRGTLTFETDALKAANKEALLNHSLDTIQRMFADVSDRIKSGKIRGDEFMQRFATSQESSYLQWVHRYADPRTLRAWNTTQWNTSNQTKVTYDMLQQLSMKGYHGAVADIRDTLEYDGDPLMTAQVESYLRGDKSAIKANYTLDQVLGGKSARRMNTAEGRAGTFFDPGAAEAAGNYMMTLPDGTQVPVLGHEAYGGKVNRYGTGEFSPSAHEKALLNLMSEYEGEVKPGRAASAREAYISSLKPFVYGKEGYLRADALDKGMSASGWLTHRASTLRYDTGEVNPFELHVGRETVAKIRDAEVREALYSGQDVFAAIARHPVSDMPFMKVSIDDTLNGTNLFGIDEGMRGLLMADQDEDPAYLFFMRRRGAGAEEAAAAVSGANPFQRRSVAFQQRLEGIADDPRSYFTTGADLKDFRLRNLFDAMKNKQTGMWTSPVSLDAALRARSTSGSIGAFSNTLTQMMIGLENNTSVIDIGKKQDLARFFFTSVRQSPISAAKLKNVDPMHPERAMDEVKALQINASLQRSIGPEGDFSDFRSALGQLAEAADAGRGTAFRDFLSENYEVLRGFHSGMDRSAVAQAARVLSAPATSAARAKVLGMDPEMLSYIRASSTDAGVAEEAGRTAAQLSAETLGMANRLITAAKATSRATRESKVGLVIGLGVALAAAAGVATGSMKSQAAIAVFDRPSANRFRPEDRAGISNQVPGGAWEGSRASRPRRQMVGAPAQTSTTLVAPINETADMDVQIRAKDRSRAIETSKLLSRIATDGDSNITINYTNQKRTSLWSRERMRTVLDRE